MEGERASIAMQRKRLAVISGFAVLVIALAAVGSALGWVCHRVRVFERTHGGDVLANISVREDDARIRREIQEQQSAATGAVASASAVTNAPPRMRVTDFAYDGGRTVRLTLAERPDMDVVRSYLEVEPRPAEPLAVSYTTRYDHARRIALPVLRIEGDFAYRTNLTLTLRRGLPILGRGADPSPDGSLAEDYVRTFRRPDAAPCVRFAAKGRYLPPGGRRTLALRSVNVAMIAAEIRRVEPRNIVQLLAEEENAYDHRDRRFADGESTEDMSGAAERRQIQCVNRINEEEVTELPVAVGDGGRTNGVFLVSVLDANRPRRDYDWQGDGRPVNPKRYQLVCVSDLALSVRSCGGDATDAWVTSLLTGRPVAGAWIEAYSTANTRVMEGRTDAGGRASLSRVAEGEPFAVVAYSPEGDDMTFLALGERTLVDEMPEAGGRPRYLSGGEVEAFVWTDRGIYRHGERMLVHAIVRDRDRKAPKPLPVEVRLVAPNGGVHSRLALVTDAEGAILNDRLCVPADQPSGDWRLVVKLPGPKGRVLGARTVKVEEFAPPQIRVEVAADAAAHPSNFTFAVRAEYLSGGPCHALRGEGAVVFEDAPFAPPGWRGWHFGNDDLGLRPSYRRLAGTALDRGGRAVFAAPLWAGSGLPRAMVRATGEGTVLEDGGRPATARGTALLHFYPYYIGSTLGTWVRREPGVRPRMALACVGPDGRRLAEARHLVMKVERIDVVSTCREAPGAFAVWESTRVRRIVADGVPVTMPPEEDAEVELPIDACGDYAVTVEDPATRVSFARTFYLSDWGDAAVRAPLANPSAVTLVPDRPSYRVGERPRLSVRSPFAGAALLTVMRERTAYAETFELTNATSEIVLRPLTAADAPNLDVALSVVQGVAADARHLAVRAHGEATVAVRPAEDEIPVALEAEVADLRSVEVSVSAPGATAVLVTVVDEGINLLTDEPVPDPVGCFAAPRRGDHWLHDLYGQVLPVLGEDRLKAGGARTGGGFGAEMLGRVSPLPTRRFRPLARWSGRLPVADGRAHVSVPLPEFAGEVRVTAVALSARATGSAAVRRKVAPRLVALPDAPRFVAPSDAFEVSLPVRNCGDGDAKLGWEIRTNGALAARCPLASLAAGAATNFTVGITAPTEPGELKVAFSVRGAGEVHDAEIPLPVRPAVPWRETAGVTRLAPGETFDPGDGRTRFREYHSPVADLVRSLDWLAEYPHGCLEQTSSRIFPLVAAGGLLASVDRASGEGARDAGACVTAGVRRLESMVRATDFVMWPDCDTAPWDPEVSLYAAHVLAEAEAAGARLTPAAKDRVAAFLRRWAMSANDEVSAYACHTLALAGTPERDRMLRLYDARERLSLVARARLARAFVRVHDRPRAEALLAGAVRPGSVKEAAFAALALLELDPDDPRILPLVGYLNDRRDRRRFHWGTTAENAHALMALGEYFRRRPPRHGERFVSWRRLELPDPASVGAETNGISVVRRLLTPEGTPADLADLRRGELLVVELEIGTEDDRVLSDLVVEDLFAGAFEPVCAALPLPGPQSPDWVMRSDARDDRMLVYSKRFELKRGEHAVFRYQVRAVSAGDYALPGVAVEGMYNPALCARSAGGRIVVRH